MLNDYITSPPTLPEKLMFAGVQNIHKSASVAENEKKAKNYLDEWQKSWDSMKENRDVLS